MVTPLERLLAFCDVTAGFEYALANVGGSQ